MAIFFTNGQFDPEPIGLRWLLLDNAVYYGSSVIGAKVRSMDYMIEGDGLEGLGSLEGLGGLNGSAQLSKPPKLSKPKFYFPFLFPNITEKYAEKKNCFCLFSNICEYFLGIKFSIHTHFDRIDHFIVSSIIKAQRSFGIGTRSNFQTVPTLAEIWAGSGVTCKTGYKKRAIRRIIFYPTSLPTGIGNL